MYHPAMHHGGCMAALNLILNFIEFRTNHEPYMVHGMVQGERHNLKSAVDNKIEEVRNG
jgi:hypothetical protein